MSFILKKCCYYLNTILRILYNSIISGAIISTLVMCVQFLNINSVLFVALETDLPLFATHIRNLH